MRRDETAEGGAAPDCAADYRAGDSGARRAASRASGIGDAGGRDRYAPGRVLRADGGPDQVLGADGGGGSATGDAAEASAGSAPPKTAASNRAIPLPQVVVSALAAHLAAFPAGPDGLVFTLAGKPIGRSAFGHKWRAAVEAAKLPAGTGFHALRHYYASLLIRHGESVKTVQSRLGHASATETLDTYSHLWPDSDGPVTRLTRYSGLRRTGCGLPAKSPGKHAGQWLGADELACKPDSVPRRRGVSNGGAAATIHLDTPLPGASSGLPAGLGEQPSNTCAAASCGAVFLTLLRVGFA